MYRRLQTLLYALAYAQSSASPPTAYCPADNSITCAQALCRHHTTPHHPTCAHPTPCSRCACWHVHLGTRTRTHMRRLRQVLIAPRASSAYCSEAITHSRKRARTHASARTHTYTTQCNATQQNTADARVTTAPTPAARTYASVTPGRRITLSAPLPTHCQRPNSA